MRTTLTVAALLAVLCWGPAAWSVRPVPPWGCPEATRCTGPQRNEQGFWTHRAGGVVELCKPYTTDLPPSADNAVCQPDCADLLHAVHCRRAAGGAVLDYVLRRCPRELYPSLAREDRHAQLLGQAGVLPVVARTLKDVKSTPPSEKSTRQVQLVMSQQAEVEKKLAGLAKEIKEGDVQLGMLDKLASVIPELTEVKARFVKRAREARKIAGRRDPALVWKEVRAALRQADVPCPKPWSPVVGATEYQRREHSAEDERYARLCDDGLAREALERNQRCNDQHQEQRERLERRRQEWKRLADGFDRRQDREGFSGWKPVPRRLFEATVHDRACLAEDQLAGLARAGRARLQRTLLWSLLALPVPLFAAFLLLGRWRKRALQWVAKQSPGLPVGKWSDGRYLVADVPLALLAGAAVAAIVFLCVWEGSPCPAPEGASARAVQVDVTAREEARP